MKRRISTVVSRQWKVALPIVITVNGSAAPCRPRNAKDWLK
ncbi:MAG: hypothetical protein ACLRS8_17890 [Parabacteroides merdae]